MCWSKLARNVTSRTILIVTSDSCNTINIYQKWITLHQIVFNTICDIIFLHQTILLSVLSCTNQIQQSAIPSQSSAAWPWKVDDESTAPTNFSYNSRPTFFNFQALACFLFYPLHILCALVCIFSSYEWWNWWILSNSPCFRLVLSIALLWLVALLISCPKEHLALKTLPHPPRCSPQSSPPPLSCPRTRDSPGERTSVHQRAATTHFHQTRSTPSKCGQSRVGAGQGDGGEGQRPNPVPLLLSVQSLWQNTSPHPHHQPRWTSVTLDGHTMAIQGRPLVNLEQRQTVICERHQVGPRGTKVTQTSTANSSR